MVSIDTNSIAFTKVVVMIVLTVTSFLCGTIPLLVYRFYEKKENGNIDSAAQARARKRRNRVISLLMAFAGGVLFCTIFIHMLPEVGEVFENLTKNKRYHDLPGFLAQALLCGGFFIMYLSEEIAHKLMHHYKKDNESKVKTNSDTHVLTLSTLSSVEEDKYASSYKKTELLKNIMSITENATQELSPEERDQIGSLIKKAIMSNSNENLQATLYGENCRQDQVPHDLTLVTSKGSGFRTFLLLMALSIHAIFEGMAIGLETKIASVWLMLLGVASHKMVLSAVMAIEMVAANVSVVVHMVYVSFFAIISTVGIGIGLLITAETDIVTAVFQGIAAGTLLYVLFFEIFERGNPERDNTSGFFALFMAVFGFAVMLTLQVVADS